MNFKGDFIENIIFFDIDGVLNDNRSMFVLESIDVLKQLIEKYNAKAVMISSWQMNGTENKRTRLKQQFEKLGIYNIDFIDPNFEGNICNIELPSRLLGIVNYLQNNNKCNYVILDNEYHNDYKLVCLNYYKTAPLKELKYKDLSKIELKPVNLKVVL